jgi:inositol monophosphatase 3
MRLDVKFFHTNKDSLLYSEDIKALPPTVDAPLSELSIWIDPLDATHEYTEGLLQYVTTMVCVAQNGVPIIGIIHKPFEKKTYWGWTGQGISDTLKALSDEAKANASKDTRIIVSRKHAGDVEKVAQKAFGDHVKIVAAGGAGYKSLELVRGAADAYVHVTLIKKWDTCAPNALVQAMGGKMTALKDGSAISYAYEDSPSIESGLLAARSFTDHELYRKSLNGL